MKKFIGKHLWKALISFAVIIFITVFGIIFFTGEPAGEPVETEAQAIVIAKAYVSQKYHQSFPGYKIRVELENDIWVVVYSLPPIYDENGEISGGYLGGGGPAVEIEKSNGKVISCVLQM